jgi:BASS family bile acid:Na+ symporter
MKAADALVLLLSIASMLAAGLAAGRSTARSPRSGWRGAALVGSNLVVLPMIALVASGALALGPATLGVMLAAAAPGGSSGPLLAGLAGGEPRAAMRLFIVLTFAGTGTALGVVGMMQAAGLVEVGRAAAIVLVVSIVPLAVAYLAASRWPSLDPRVDAWLSRASALLLLVTVGLLGFQHAAEASLSAAAASLPIVGISLALGLLMRGRKEALAAAQVSAVRNLTLGLVVLTAVRAPAAATAALLTYGLVMYAGASIVVAFARYSSRVAS